MSAGSERLSDQEVADRLRTLPEWNVSDGKLARSFAFEDFMEAVDFVNRLAEVAEAQGHHPDLFVSWGRVDVMLTTHSAGGITAADFGLAELIQKL